MNIFFVCFQSMGLQNNSCLEHHSKSRFKFLNRLFINRSPLPIQHDQKFKLTICTKYRSIFLHFSYMSVVSYSIKKNTAVTIPVLWFSILREITIKVQDSFSFRFYLLFFFFYLFIHYTLFYSPIFDQAQASDQ